MTRASEIIARHVAAAVAELREYAVGEAIAALTAPRVRQERAARVKAPTPAPKRESSPQRKPAAVNARPCGCLGRGRHRSTCSEAKPPQPVEQSPRATADSPRVKAPVDVVKAERFARLEAAAQKRNGAAA